MDPLTQMLISSGLSAGAGWLANKTRKSQPGSGGGYDVVNLPQYSFTEPRLRLISDFVSDNLTRIGQGKRPAYYDAAVPYIRENLERPLRTTFFGRPGERTGTLQAAQEVSAALGVGPRASMAATNKALARYEDASKQIDEFIEKTGVDVTQESLRTSIYAGLSIPKGPDAQVVSYGGYAPQQTAGIGDYLASLAGDIPYLYGAANKQKQQLYEDTPSGFGDVSNLRTPPFNPQQPPYYSSVPRDDSGAARPSKYSSYINNAEQVLKMLRQFTNLGNPAYGFGGYA